MVRTFSPPAEPSQPSPGRRTKRIVLGGVALAMVVVVVIAVMIVRDLNRPVPSFSSLAEHPDASIHGTVAYFAAGQGCVRLVAAGGGPAKDVMCLPPADMSKAAALGTKENGPQLVWLADGRLEVTMFRSDPKSGTFSAGWQKIVDVRASTSVDVPAADVPAQPNLSTRPTVSPSGQRITATSDESSGRVKVTLTDPTGTRTVLSTRGPGSYTYSLRSAFWSPDFSWIAADDGRILVITPGPPATVRVLVDETKPSRASGGTGGLSDGDARLSSFAVTAADLLTLAT